MSQWFFQLGPQEGFCKIAGLFLVIMIAGVLLAFGGQGPEVLGSSSVQDSPLQQDWACSLPLPPPNLLEEHLCRWKAVCDYLSLKPNCVFHINTDFLSFLFFLIWHGFNIQWLFQENCKLIYKCNSRENFTSFYLESKVAHPHRKLCHRRNPACGVWATESPSLSTCICYPCIRQVLCVAAGRGHCRVLWWCCAWAIIIYSTLFCHL